MSHLVWRGQRLEIIDQWVNVSDGVILRECEDLLEWVADMLLPQVGPADTRQVHIHRVGFMGSYPTIEIWYKFSWKNYWEKIVVYQFVDLDGAILWIANCDLREVFPEVEIDLEPFMNYSFSIKL